MVDTSKYEGKTAAELVEMLKAQEKFQGEQATVIGELRGAVRNLNSKAEDDARRKAADSGPRTNEYRPIVNKTEAERVILDPEKGLNEALGKTRESAVEEAERRVYTRLDQKAKMDAQIDKYMTDNPVLGKWKDVFSVAGANVYQQNPNATLPEILDGAKKATLAWLDEKGIKAEDEHSRLERVRPGITTSGGSGNRDTEGTRRAEGVETTRTASTGKPEDDNILNAISEIKTWREKRITPPRSAVSKA